MAIGGVLGFEQNIFLKPGGGVWRAVDSVGPSLGFYDPISITWTHYDNFGPLFSILSNEERSNFGPEFNDFVILRSNSNCAENNLIPAFYLNLRKIPSERIDFSNKIYVGLNSQSGVVNASVFGGNKNVFNSTLSGTGFNPYNISTYKNVTFRDPIIHTYINFFFKQNWAISTNFSVYILVHKDLIYKTYRENIKVSPQTNLGIEVFDDDYNLIEGFYYKNNDYPGLPYHNRFKDRTDIYKANLNFDLTTVRPSLYSTFANCVNLNYVYCYPSHDPNDALITEIENCFYNCSNLEYIDDNLSLNLRNITSAFKQSGLLEIPSIGQAITYCDEAFMNCYRLNGSIQQFIDDHPHIESHTRCFKNCTNMEDYYVFLNQGSDWVV